MANLLSRALWVVAYIDKCRLEHLDRLVLYFGLQKKLAELYHQVNLNSEDEFCEVLFDIGVIKT
jgi:hypothetical protein